MLVTKGDGACSKTEAVGVLLVLIIGGNCFRAQHPFRVNRLVYHLCTYKAILWFGDASRE